MTAAIRPITAMTAMPSNPTSHAAHVEKSGNQIAKPTETLNLSFASEADLK
jgi:hypothetical protein